MREANPIDTKTLVAGPTSAGGTNATASEPADAAGANGGHDLPTVHAPTSGRLTQDSTDLGAATLDADPSTLTGSSYPRAACVGVEPGRTVAVAPYWGSTADSAAMTTDGRRPRYPATGRSRQSPATRFWASSAAAAWASSIMPDKSASTAPVALKMILAGAHTDALTAIRFLDEAKAIARLQHPNVVQIHHIGDADGLPYFELEYLDGGALDRRLDGTPWPARRAASLVEPLALAVAEAHRLGIVHRDLKPANVLLASDGTPKVTDFGLVKWLADEGGLTATESILGSPSYMAPEQAGGHGKQVGPAADVYALGAILYELLVGRPPFRGASILETLEQVQRVEPVPPSRLVPGTPRDLETIALKCLQKEPGWRYESAGELAEDLRRFLAGEPILARPIGVWERAVKWARRRPAAAVTAATLLLTTASLLAMGAWSYRSIGRRPRPCRVPPARGDRRRLPCPPGRDQGPPIGPDTGLARHRAGKPPRPGDDGDAPARSERPPHRGGRRPGRAGCPRGRPPGSGAEGLDIGSRVGLRARLQPGRPDGDRRGLQWQPIPLGLGRRQRDRPARRPHHGHRRTLVGSGRAARRAVPPQRRLPGIDDRRPPRDPPGPARAKAASPRATGD